MPVARSFYFLAFFFFFRLLRPEGLPQAHAFHTSARISTGGFLSNESFLDPGNTTLNDNIALLSSRLYLKSTDQTLHDFSMTLDLRDQADAFGRLDSARQRLVPKHAFQVYQLASRMNNPQGLLYGSVGRFALSNAGGTFIDGAELGIHWTPSFSTALFGGLEPKTRDQLELTWNPGASVLGGYTHLLIPQFWGETPGASLSWTEAWVAERNQSHLDRLFAYQQLHWSFSSRSYLTHFLYWDFIPRSRVQTALLSYHQSWTEGFRSTLNYSLIDVIEYTRRKHVLERLPSSPYQELGLNLHTQASPQFHWDWNFYYGHRRLDRLSRAEFSMGPTLLRFLFPRLQLRGLIGARSQFITQDLTSQFLLDYLHASSAVNFSLAYVLSSQKPGPTLHKWMAEASIQYALTRDFLGSLAFSEAADERVRIWSAYMRVTFLLGQKEMRVAPDVPATPSEQLSTNWRL